MSSMIIFIVVAAVLAIIYLVFYIYGIIIDRRKKYGQVLGGSTRKKISDEDINNGVNDLDFHHEKANIVFGAGVDTILSNSKTVSLSHLPPDSTHAEKHNRILDTSKRERYKRRTYQFKPQLHWGQMKLFLTEVEFLTKVLELKPTKKIVMVYAGAAPGHHTKYLQGMFPDIRFELYDPNDFAIENDKMINIHIQFFTDKDAEHWRDTAAKEDLFLVFCTDVRTEPATEENVKRNMAMQLKWWQIMNPELSMFKFRLPWGNSDLP